MPQKLSMQIMSVPRVIRKREELVNSPSPSHMPNINQRRSKLGNMGMINRVRFAPAGCSSCGGR